jgi:Flp pilus assembly protein TadD
LDEDCGGDLNLQIRFAILLARVGKSDAAHEKIEALRRAAPELRAVNNYEALVYYRVGDYEKAEKILEAAPDAAAADPETKSLQGILLAHMGDFSEATPLLVEAVSVQPSELNVFNLAYTLYLHLQFERVRQYLLDLVHDCPTSFIAYMVLGAVDHLEYAIAVAARVGGVYTARILNAKMEILLKNLNIFYLAPETPMGRRRAIFATGNVNRMAEGLEPVGLLRR